jgi:hypothetical protein
MPRRLFQRLQQLTTEFAHLRFLAALIAAAKAATDNGEWIQGREGFVPGCGVPMRIRVENAQKWTLFLVSQ